MMERIKKIGISLFVLATLAGCATVPEPVAEENSEDTQKSSGTTKTLLTIGGVLVLGAILIDAVDDNVEDAVRGATRQ